MFELALVRVGIVTQKTGYCLLSAKRIQLDKYISLTLVTHHRYRLECKMAVL